MSVETRELLCIVSALVGSGLLFAYAALSCWARGKDGAEIAAERRKTARQDLKYDLIIGAPLLAALAMVLWFIRGVQVSGRGMALAFLAGSVLALAMRVLDTLLLPGRRAEDQDDDAGVRAAGLGGIPVGVALAAAAVLSFWQAQNMGTVVFGLFAPALIIALIAVFARSEAPLARNLALFGLLLAACMALGHYRLHANRLALLLPLLVSALAVPVYIVVSHLLGNRWLGRAGWLAMLVHLVGTALLLVVGVVIVRAMLGDDAKSLPLTWGLGLVVGLVVWWLAYYTGGRSEELRIVPEAMVGLAVLIGLGLVVAYGKAAGFGVGLFGLGAFAWLGLATEGDAAAGAEAAPDEAAERSPPERKLTAATRTAQLGAAFVALFLIVRCAAERGDWRAASFDPRDTWRFFGLLLGLLLPLAVVSLARRQPASRALLRRAHAAWLVVLLMALTGAMAFFWRGDTLTGLLGGFALAALLALLMQWHDPRTSFVPGGLAALMCGLMALHFVPKIHLATGGEGRLARVLILLAAVVVAAVVSAILGALSTPPSSAPPDEEESCEACP